MNAPSRQGRTKEIYWRKTIDRWSESGLSQIEFCKREGLNASNLCWWKRALAARDSAPAQNGIEFEQDPDDEQKENYWREMVARFRTSGLSKDVFCKKEDIKAQAFCWWRGEISRRDSGRKRTASPAPLPTARMFVPLKTAESPAILLASTPKVVAEIDILQGTVQIFDNAATQTIAMLFAAIRRSAE